ncbi:MAG TPA: site-specific DNA-methyltransferase, partial [Firmicutes bacterium]|nr:site-specific DNA-methyltransferase [Bacillota bacterium]
GNRKYIMVQLPEPCPKNSHAYNAGFRNISDIGKERIRRAAKNIKEETGAEIDYGFRVFRVDTSNMKDFYYHPEKLTQQQIAATISNIKDDRTPDDLLFQVMLQWGLKLSLPMAKRNILGKNIHFVAGNSLVACFDEDISEDLIREIARGRPQRVVFRDSSFSSDASRINAEEIFKGVSPVTEINVF